MRAGWIISTGTANWSPKRRAPGATPLLAPPSDTVRKLLYLQSNVGNRGNLPERGPACRTDRKQSRRGHAPVVDDRAIGVDIDADVQGVGPRHALRDELTEQRVGASGRLNGRAGAANNTRGEEVFAAPRTAPPDRDACAALIRRDAENPAWDDLDLAAGDKCAQPVGDLRRHPMAMNVPPRPCMFEEPAARRQRHGAP
jgi:hypothetical protein